MPVTEEREVIFINDVIDEIVPVLLNVKRKDIEEISAVSQDDRTRIFLTLKKRDMICPFCRSERKMVNNGYYERKVIIPNKAFEKTEVIVQTRRYRCLRCGHTVSDTGHMTPANVKVSYSSISEVMDLLKDPHMTFREVSSITGISETTVIRIFDRYCHIPRVPLPEILCIDEVYTKNSDYKSKYSCIFYDFRKHGVVDVLPSRRKDYLRMYLSKIQTEERNGVKYVCIDMYLPYKQICEIYLKKAVICVDSFHVVKHVNDDLNRLRIRYMKSYDPDSQEYYLLNRFRFLLLDRKIDLDNKPRFNKKFGRYLNYRQLLEMILSISDEIRKAYELKEEYVTFNAKFTKEEAEESYDILVDDFVRADIPEYSEFITLLKNWKQEIINSFVRIDEIRINNGIAESINESVSLIIYNTKGIRNSERRRKRIMYSINRNGFNLI